jgi:hypothetical protein
MSIENDSPDWNTLALEMHRLAQQQTHGPTKVWLTSLAAEYERLVLLTGQGKESEDTAD